MYTNRSSHSHQISRFVSLLLVLILALSASLVGNAAPPEQTGPIAGTVSLPPEALQAQINLSIQKTALDGKQDSAIKALAEAARVSTQDALQRADAAGLRRSGELIHIQAVTTPARLKSAANVIEQAGGQVTGVAWDDTLLQGWLPIQALEIVAADPQVDYLRLPEQVSIFEQDAGGATTEGLSPMNAPAWHSAGYQGAGVKVAIIDGGFLGYTSLLGSDLPGSVTVANFVDADPDPVDGTTEHGTANAEIVYDIVPQASLYLAKIATNIDLQEAVAWAKSNSVDVISTSVGWYNLTPGDGTGEFANIVQDARNNGILWATAAGNNREAHWGGVFNDPDGDDYHQFNGTQEINYFGPGNGDAYLINPGFDFSIFLRWDDWTSVNQDYNLILVRWDGSSWVMVASSANPQNGGAGQTPTEDAAYTTSGDPAPYGFVIARSNSSRNVNLEAFAPNFAPLDERVNARSLSNLADVPDVVTVAALDVNSPYPQESYSSEGPTNGPGGTEAGGSIKPDLSGYANVSTMSYGAGAFSGTSPATPHVAGAAALVQNAYPAYTPTQIESFLTSRAVDMGAVGLDNAFGYGRLYLGAPPAANTAPTISGLPDQFIPQNGSKNNAIDLWAYANDNETSDSGLTFTINNSPNASAGVTLDSNRYVDITPAAAWTGQTDVEIKVADPGGLFSTDTFKVTVIAGKIWTGSVSTDWHTAGNWNPTGVPTVSDNVTIPDELNDPLISTANATVNGLTINPGAVVDLSNRLLTVEGTVINNGALKQTQPVTQSSTTNFLRLTNQAATQTKYYGLDFTPSVSSSVTVMVSGNQFCQGRMTGVKRCYDVSPASAQTATVRFYFAEAERNDQVLANLKTLHYSGVWTTEAGSTTSGGSGDAQYVQTQNISDFSPFALDTPGGPSKVFLPIVRRFPPPAAPTNLVAVTTSSSTIHLTWNDNASNETGYKLERSPDGSAWSPLITLPVNTNSRDDTGLQPNTPYYYRVKAVNGDRSSAYSNTASAVTQSSGPSLCNGDFEQGSGVCWTEYSTHGWSIISTSFPGSVSPRSGSWAAWLGGDYDDLSYVEQQVAVTAGSPYLAYYHWIASSDACGFDYGGVLVNGLVVDVYDLCSSQNTGGWVHHVVDLSAYIGQTVTLQIRVETDSTDNSNLFIDDVAFQSSPTASGSAAPLQVDPAQALPRLSRPH
jgi:subtilisin family serine protease